MFELIISTTLRICFQFVLLLSFYVRLFVNELIAREIGLDNYQKNAHGMTCVDFQKGQMS